MSFLLVAYPTLIQADLDWIEGYRRQHDQLASVIAAHFTLVFQVNEMREAAFAEEVESLIAGAAPITFCLAIAAVRENVFSGQFQEQLEPLSGAAEISALHHRLYGGAFRAYRANIEYLPHVTIGASADAAAALARVEKINMRNIEMKGEIDALDMIEFCENRVRPVRRFSLR